MQVHLHTLDSWLAGWRVDDESVLWFFFSPFLLLFLLRHWVDLVMVYLHLDWNYLKQEQESVAR